MSGRSIVDNFLNTLGVLSPTNEKYEEIRNILSSVSISILCTKLENQRLNLCFDRVKMIRSLRLDKSEEMILLKLLETTENNIWNRLRYCGSGITRSMFKGIPITGDIKSNNPLLPNLYTNEFLTLFEYLYLRDSALRKIELNMLEIGRLYNRDKLIFSLSSDMIDLIMGPKTKLINIIAKASRSIHLSQGESNPLIYSIGKCLVYKAKHDPSVSSSLYERLKIWIKEDPILGTTILLSTRNPDHTYNITILEDRFRNRIRSHKKLTGKIASF